MFEAIIYGYKYPIALLETVVRRVKTDKDVSITGNRIRAGLIKAVLNRMAEKEEIPMTKLIVNTDCPKETIDKNIYGHFSEHLGRCIYGGSMWARILTFPTWKGCGSM